MKKGLLIIILLSMFATACKTTKQTLPDGSNGTTMVTANIVPPLGFSWENSRNVYFTVKATDGQFSGVNYLISVYDADPANGGKLLIKGSASAITAFTATLYLSNLVTQVYLVKTAPDASTTTQIVKLSSTVVNTTI